MDREVAAHLGTIRERIAEACFRRGRNPSDVRIVAASKAQPVDRIRAAAAAGVEVFGENRVQEAMAKRAELRGSYEWHLLGPLQSNKVKPALELFTAFHAVDRMKIARALDREAGRRGITVAGYLEVNLGEEGTKHGFSPDTLAVEVRPIAAFRSLEIVGLMAIPPQTEDPEAARPWFRRLRELRDTLAERREWEGFPGRLSMGMSADYAVAVEEGATDVRIGTALFGERG